MVGTVPAGSRRPWGPRTRGDLHAPCRPPPSSGVRRGDALHLTCRCTGTATWRR